MLRAIVSGYEPQHDLMRAACRMTRWIDPDRPQELTLEQSLSVNEDPYIHRLVAQREKWKRRFRGTVTQQPGYHILSREIFNARQRQRAALLKQVQGRWDPENPVNEVELQLSGLKFDQDVKTNLDLADDMAPVQRRLVETMMTLPGTTLEEESPDATLPSMRSLPTASLRKAEPLPVVGRHLLKGPVPHFKKPICS